MVRNKHNKSKKLHNSEIVNDAGYSMILVQVRMLRFT